MKKTITIGRKPENHIIVNSTKVSGKHCQITQIAENQFLIEDLQSTNGTFINQKRIASCLINPTDICTLENFDIDLQIVLYAIAHENIAIGTPYENLVALHKEQRQTKEEFAKLEAIYQKYISDKKKILTNANIKSSGTRAALAFIPIIGTSLAMLSGATDKSKEALIDLGEQFKEDYVCPKCSNFLGEIPFANLKKRGTCLICKAKWV